jgi:hypothetical protein
MKRRELMGMGLAFAGTLGLSPKSLAQDAQGGSAGFLSATQDYRDLQNILLQDVGDFSQVPVFGFPGIGQLSIGQLPNIDFFKLIDLPNIGNLRLGQVPGFVQELANLLENGTFDVASIFGNLGIPSVGDLGQLAFSQVQGLAQQFIGGFQSLLGFNLGGLPGFNLIPGFNLGNLVSITLGNIPGLNLLPFNFLFGGGNLVPSMVELVTFKQYKEDGVLFVIDRGRPWAVGETRYVTPNFRITLDRIIDHGPGTGYFKAEVLVPFVGWVPIPWADAHEQSYGLWVPPQGGAVPPPVQGNPYNPKASLPSNPAEAPSNSTNGGCGDSYRGVNEDAYARAISGIEGGYGSVGIFIDKPGKQGRGLGRYQFVTYRSDVRAIINAKPGGSGFLAKADSGASLSSGETLKYFTAAEQDALFQKDSKKLLDLAANTTDPTTGKNFTGGRLIERAAQTHFGGPGIPIDGGGSDGNRRLSVYGYGKTALKNYQKALGKQNCGGVK